jgi:succinate dehydrogenase/fumarate reductase flavoprotein subunit
MQQTAWDSLLVHMDETMLEKSAKTFADIAQQAGRAVAATPYELAETLELRNMVEIAPLLRTACQMRKESRGDHARLDYPDQNTAEWTKVIVIERRADDMAVETEVIDPEWSAKQNEKELEGYRWG